jgi:hypothetical protein
MHFEYISKDKFNNIKDTYIEWIEKKLKKDIDTIFVFSNELTSEDKKFIYRNCDNFIIDKNKIVEIDNFENITHENKENKENNNYEIILRVGRKYYNKLQKYPLKNMNILNVINDKVDNNSILIKSIFVLNVLMFYYTYTK